MSDVIAIVVDWIGPFSTLAVARSKARDWDLGEALYMATGKRPYQRRRDLQYVGIAKRIEQRLHDGRTFENDIVRDFGIWIGEVVSHAVAGKRRVRHAQTVDYAEWGTAFFLEVWFNERKRKKPPPRPIALINRWYHPDGDRRRQRRPIAEWPDLIEYEGPGQSARIAWLGAPPRLYRLSTADVAALCLE